MRKIKQVLRMRAAGLSARQIAGSVGAPRSTVADYLKRATDAGISWPTAAEWEESVLEAMLFPVISPAKPRFPFPDYAYIHTELKKKGVTLTLLWEEYRLDNPDGYLYTQFCHYYRQFRNKLNLSMRQIHKAGEKLFVDFAGKTMPIVDPETGEIREAHVFVAVLGASNYTYVEAVWSQNIENWVDCHIHAFEFFGGVAAITIPDNLKAGVTKPCWYEPQLNLTYQDMAEHYGTAIIPARVRKPKDKSKAEVGVQVITRWILARLRKHTFFSLTELNEHIAALLEWANNKRFIKLEGTRKSLFESLEKSELLPLPHSKYEFALFRKATVNIDYHIEFDKHYYSVPHQIAREVVEVRATRLTLEVLFRGKRIASHPRSYITGGHTTTNGHMPKSHREYGEWSVSRIIIWANKIGPNCAGLVEALIASKRHPVQGFRSALGIIRLADTFGAHRLETAAMRALTAGALSYRSVSLILKNGLDKVAIETQQELILIDHNNIRGGDYYH